MSRNACSKGIGQFDEISSQWVNVHEFDEFDLHCFTGLFNRVLHRILRYFNYPQKHFLSFLSMMLLSDKQDIVLTLTWLRGWKCELPVLNTRAFRICRYWISHFLYTSAGIFVKCFCFIGWYCVSWLNMCTTNTSIVFLRPNIKIDDHAVTSLIGLWT